MNTYVVQTQTRDRRQYETTIRADGFYRTFDFLVFYRRGFLWWRHPKHTFQNHSVISVIQSPKDK